jgi:Right handed beta helix region/Bacterial TSP3 repeat
LKWLVLSMVVLACLAATVSAGTPRDRDHDRLPDRWERTHRLSTTTPSARRDPDRDRLNNRRELRLRTHPRRADTDRDLLRDGAEVRRFHTNPRRRDTDGDGFHDRCELRRGTNPRRRRSHPKRPCPELPQEPPRHPAPAPPGGVPPTAPTGGLPDASNTGVPAGTTLTPRTGPITISTAGTVIDGLDVTASGRQPAISVNAPNVTIRNTRVRGNTIALVQNNSTGLVVEDSELMNQPVAGQPNCHNGIATGNYTARRLEITGCENGAEMFRGNVVFEGNWIHDLDTVGPSYVFGTEGPHTDGIQLNNGGANVQIRHNNIDPVPPGERGTAGIIANSAGDGVRIEDNRIDGGGTSYAIYAPRTSKTAWFINRNRLLKGVIRFHTGCVRVGVTVTEFNGNVDDITWAPVPPDNGGDGGCTN